LQAQSLGTSIQPSPLLTKISGIGIAKVSAVDDDCLTGLEARLMRAISNASEDRTRTEWLGCKKQTLTDWL
jgi:hypothetical protein